MGTAASHFKGTHAMLDGVGEAFRMRCRYERSYDVTLARRTLAGKTFISLNIMWAYREQASFAVRQPCRGP